MISKIPDAVKNKILSKDETLDSMACRVFSSISKENASFKNPGKDPVDFKDELLELFISQYIVPGTPILANAGRPGNTPLSAISVPYLNENTGQDELESIVHRYHKKGLGTGFNFDADVDPVSKLLFINNISIEETKNNMIYRPVANIGIISIDHPKIIEFINYKNTTGKDIDWKFNLSVNIDDKFIKCFNTKKDYTLKDGNTIPAHEFYEEWIKAFFCFYMC